MKRLILTLSIIGYLFAQPSPEGNWKLSGLEVDYIHIAREDVSVQVCDTYGQGFCVEVAAIPTGVYYTVIPKRYSLEGLANYGVNLNVNVLVKNLIVEENIPYSGGFITQFYGNPSNGIHVLQLEINRSIFMDEKLLKKNRNIEQISKKIRKATKSILLKL